jgi:hypothetical protein
MKKFKITLSYILGGVVLLGVVALAGSLTPTGSTSTGTMYTTSDIYNKLTTGTDATERNHPTSTTTTPNPEGTMFSLKQIYEAITNIQQEISDSSTSVPYGIYSTTTLDTIDTDLTASNIATGTTMFGILGTYTGAVEWQTPDPGVNLCWGPYDSTWEGGAPDSCLTGGAVDYCNNLVYQGHDDWRLPSAGELVDAFHTGVPGSFAGYYYWSRVESGYDSAWYVGNDGGTYGVYKDNENSVRCVR